MTIASVLVDKQRQLLSLVTDSANDPKGVSRSLFFIYFLFCFPFLFLLSRVADSANDPKGVSRSLFFFCRVWQSAVADSGNDANRIAMRLFARVSVCFYYSISLLYYSTRLVLLQFYWY